MLRTVRGDIATNDASALVFFSPEDYSPEVYQALLKKYPGLQTTLNRLNSSDKWVSGMVSFYPKDKPVLVFVNLKDPETGKPSYRMIRDTFRKLATEALDRGLKRLAVGPLGCGGEGNHITVDGIEVVIPAAITHLNSKLEVDLYR